MAGGVLQWPDGGRPSNTFTHPAPYEAAKPPKPILSRVWDQNSVRSILVKKKTSSSYVVVEAPLSPLGCLLGGRWRPGWARKYEVTDLQAVRPQIRSQSTLLGVQDPPRRAMEKPASQEQQFPVPGLAWVLPPSWLARQRPFAIEGQGRRRRPPSQVGGLSLWFRVRNYGFSANRANEKGMSLRPSELWAHRVRDTTLYP